MFALPAHAETSPRGAPSEAQSNSANAETDTGAQDGTTEDNAIDDSGPEDTDTANEPVSSENPKPTVLIDVDKATQQMTVFVDGIEKYSWPVSTGMRGYSTPSGTYTPKSMNEIWYSKQWDNAPMPHAIFFTKKGHAIHGSLDTKHLGSAASHGCVRISPQSATTLYTLVKETGLENVQVVLSGTTKGGEGPKVVSTPPRDDDGAYPPWFDRGDQYYQQQRPRRRGLFGRRWFQPYGPQGYYAPRGYHGLGPRGY
jgi:L,D-transpeptidase catalytic domain